MARFIPPNLPSFAVAHASSLTEAAGLLSILTSSIGPELVCAVCFCLFLWSLRLPRCQPPFMPPPLSLVYGQATRGDLRPLVVRGWGVSMSQPLCRRDRVTSSRDICPGGTSQDPKPNRHKAPPFTPGVDQKLAGEAGPTTAVLPTPGTAASTCTTCWLPLPPSAPYIL